MSQGSSTRNQQNAQPGKPSAQNREWNERDEANKRRFGVDTGGLAAQDLPDAAHGQNVVDPAEEMTRNLPHQHGGEILDDPNAEGGLRGAREITDADDRGGRKHN